MIYFHKTIYYIWKASVYIRTYVGLLIQKNCVLSSAELFIDFQTLILLLCFMY